MTAIVGRSSRSRKLVRVLACVAAPFDPAEVDEIAAADVLLDGDDIVLETLQTKTFSVVEGKGGISGACCTPMHVSAAVWGRRSPDALAAHDASTMSCVFNRGITGPLPWISLHKVARRVWPGQASYDVHALSRWRAWAGPSGPFTSKLPSGAERDCEMAAGLLIELLRDPGLSDVAKAAWLEQAARNGGRGGGAPSLDLVGREPLDAALIASIQPSMPLRAAPWPFDDQREWASVGYEDLRHYARFSEGISAKAAHKELASRARRI